MEQIISKEELDELMKIKGEVRGVAIKGEMDFVLKEEGKEGFKKLKDTMEALGYPIEYRKIKPMDFYPLGLHGTVQLAIKRLFNWDDKKFQEMGRFEAKTSLITRLFMRYFFSSEKIVEEAPKMWREYFTVGDLKIIEYDEEKGYSISRLENFRIHPIQCQVLIGYFSSIVQMVIGGRVIGEETKCVFRGDEYHEFLLKTS